MWLSVPRYATVEAKRSSPAGGRGTSPRVAHVRLCPSRRAARERPEAALPRRDRDDAPAHPALAPQSDVVQPAPEVSSPTTHRRVRTARRDTPPSSRVRRVLPRQLGRRRRARPQARGRGRHAARGSRRARGLGRFVADSGPNVSSSSASGRPAKRERPSRTNRHFSVADSPGAKLAVAIAPGLTIGLVRPPVSTSSASSELKGRPVALTPTRRCISSGPRTSQTSAKVNGLATLMIVNGISASPTACTRPSTEATQTP